MKNLRYYRVLSTARGALYLALLAALSWFLIRNSEARNSIGAFGVSLLWIFIVFAAVIIVTRWSQQQKAPMIYPFANTTGDKENKEKYDALALNFSELLQLEIQRIRNLLYIPESIAIHNPAFSKEQVPRPIITPAGPAALGSARVEEELGEMLKGIGALSFGPFSLPLGGLLYLLVQVLQGGGITGKIQKFGGKLSVVASYENRKYECNSDTLLETEQSDEAIAMGLARQLAYMMSSDFADFPPSRWQSFREVIDGLENYRRYLLSGKRNLSALDAAHKHFEQATVEDSQYAWAYYNLGVLYEEQENLDSAFEMYKQAVQAEPNLREAQFQLGKAYFQRGQLLNAVNAGRRAVELAQKTRKPFPVARTFLGKWLHSLSNESQSNFAEALKYCNQALDQLKAAKKEYTRLIKQERRRVDFSEQRLAGLRAGAIYSLKELGQAYQILANLLEGVPQENAFRRKIIDARKKAEIALQQCLKLYPESSAAYSELGRFYMEQKNYQLALKHLESAGGISPEDKSVVLGLGATYLSPAFDVLTSLIKEFHENPDGWQANWPQQRISATQSQLRLADVHYQAVIDLIRSQGEAGVDDQNSMMKALNGLASVYGAQAFIQGIQNEDCTSLITNAKEYLGKALVLNPLASEVYDNLAGIHFIESEVRGLASKSIAVDKGKVTNAESSDMAPPSQIATSPSQSEMIEQAYAILTDYVRNYGEIDPYLTTGIAMALATSTPEQRASRELVSQFLTDDSMAQPSLDKIEASSVSQVYLWAAGWMFVTIGRPGIGIQYLEKAEEMGGFPEADLVDYDLGNVYLGLKEWNRAVEYFQKIVPDDPYYWQSRITLADTVRTVELLGIDLAYETSFPQKILPEVSESLEMVEGNLQGSDMRGESQDIEEHQSSAQETALVALPPEKPEQEKFSRPKEKLDAEKIYTDAILAAGNDPYRRATALAARGELLRDKKTYDKAVKDLKESLSLVPAYAYPHRILALIYMELYDYDSAIEHWKRVGELIQDLDESQYHQGLGDAYSSKGASSSDLVKAEAWRWRAVQEYQHAIRLLSLDESRDKANTLIVLGDILVDLKQFKEAEIAYLAALEISRGILDEYSLHTKLAFVYVKLGLYGSGRSEYQKAIAQCEKQIKSAEGTTDARVVGPFADGLAYACNLQAYYLHAERGVNLDEGLALINRALVELERSNLDEANKREKRGAYLDTRGWLYYRQGEYDLARRDLEEALSLTMGTVYEHGHLALVYERLAESSQDENERKRLQMLSKEQWKLAFDLDQEGIWNTYKLNFSHEVLKQ